jgi:hypothetical protein
LTVGVTQTAGGVGIASTTYLRGVIMHNTGLGTVHHHFTFIQWSTPVTGVGITAHRLVRVDLHQTKLSSLR